MIGSFNLASFLALINSILSTGTAVTAFSLLLYILRYNWRAPVARAFSVLLGGVMLVYVGDAILYHVTDQHMVETWLRGQWIGIALVPAAYFHFADAVLRTTNSFDRVRRYFVYLAYVAGFLFLGLALFSDLIVTDGVFIQAAPHLRPGPLFWVYAAYFISTVIAGFIVRHVDAGVARFDTCVDRASYAVVAVGRRTRLATERYMAGFRPVAEQAIVARGMVNGVAAGISRFVASVGGATDAVVTR